MATHPKTSARSLYRQVRLTATQEDSGRTSYSVYAKGLGQQWNERQCILRSSVQVPGRLDTTEDVIWMLLRVLEDEVLPHHTHWVHCGLDSHHEGICLRTESS
uniref:Uncharacterized protein n=1 Tax=uncultured prokaryote TaxID=198431 RepID=A0A0H5QLW3_9ZZZZ|nr:hypothetical protein [uncultured prokaryote]